jgi:hypothetical protein
LTLLATKVVRTFHAWLAASSEDCFAELPLIATDCSLRNLLTDLAELKPIFLSADFSDSWSFPALDELPADLLGSSQLNLLQQETVATPGRTGNGLDSDNFDGCPALLAVVLGIFETGSTAGRCPTLAGRPNFALFL